MSSLKAEPAQLHRIKQARIERGWTIDNSQWLIEASKILDPDRDWDRAEKLAISIRPWKNFLKGEAIRPQTFKAFCQVLGLDWREIVANTERNSIANCDWGEIPDTSMFVARTTEANTLDRYTMVDRVRLLTVVGIGGIGKTSLVAKVTRQIAGEFEYVIWRSLREAPPVEKIIADCIKLISGHQAIDLPQTLGEQITVLIDLLRSARCLIILDNAESIIPSGALAGIDRTQANGYGELLRRIGESAHQSCTIVTSREQFRQLRRLQGESTPVRVLQLAGLPHSAVEILDRKGLFGTNREIEYLISRYHGNPLALEIVAATIKNTCAGSIAEFAKLPIVFGEIKDLLTSQFDRLSPIESSVIYWLAIHREPVTAQGLAADVLNRSLGDIITAIDCLLDRSLIQSTTDGFTLQNVVTEYVTERFVELIWQELDDCEFDLFRTHAIIQATAKDYIRETQQRLLLAPTIDRLKKDRCVSSIEQKLRSTIDYFRQEQLNSIDSEKIQPKYKLKIGYAIGNIVNLLVALQIDFTGYDLSYLPICQAYLQGVNFQFVNLAHCHLEKTVFSQALGSIFSVTFSPDQKLLATGGMDGQIRIWRVADGHQLLAWQAHGDWIRNVTFSPDGKLIASSSNDRTVRIWDWDQMACLQILRGHTDWVWSARFVVWKGLMFVVSVSSDRTGKVWNLNISKCVFTFREPDEIMWSVAFSNNGYTLASSSAKSVKLWNIWTKRCIKIIENDAERIRALAFSPDGKTLVGSDDNSIKIWDVNSGECLDEIEPAANSSIWSLTYSPDGQQLISAGTDKFQIWDAHNWQPLTTVSELQGRIRSIAYSADRSTVAVGSDEQLVRIWDAKTGRSLKTLHGVSNRIWTIALSPQLASGDVYLASGSDDACIRIWNAKTGELLRTKSGHTGRIRSLSFSPSGKLLASASHDRTIKIWDIATGTCLKTWRGHTDWVWAVTFCRDERTIISASDDRTILRWDTHTNESELLHDPQSEWIWSLASHPQLPLLAIAGTSQQIELLNLDTNTIETILRGHNHRVRSIEFNTTGDRLASSSDDLSIKLWDLNRHQCLRTLVGHTKEIRSLAFIPTSATTPEMLISASDDLTLRVWNADTGDCLAAISGHQRSTWSLCYSCELNTLYSCSEDETIKCWNLETLACTRTLTLAKPYQGTNITNISGLSLATQSTLTALGAVAS
jgi:WD40 repeat protein